MKVYIYILLDPRDGAIRYVGMTTIGVVERLSQHVRERNSSDSHKNKWLRKLNSSGLKPEILCVDIVDAENWEIAEQWWIRRMKESGFNLVNSTAGGDGFIELPREIVLAGAKKSSETRKKKGLHQSDHQKEAVRNAALRRWSRDGEKERASKITSDRYANNPNARKETGDSIRQAYQDPKVRANKSRATREAWLSKKIREGKPAQLWLGLEALVGDTLRISDFLDPT